jgi:ubiquinone biosynthesis UbiH/UbiF/VisC/COQ6 family hydroxylase
MKRGIMTHNKCDPRVCVVGGGLVGLAFSLLCAKNGIPTALIECHVPPPASTVLSARVSALNVCSLQLLSELGLWPLADVTSSGVFRSLHVWDALTGAHITFDSAEIGEPYLGYNIDNASLVDALWQCAIKNPNLRLLAPMTIKRLLNQTDRGITLELTNGELFEPDCLVAADGAESWLRQQMEMSCKEEPYKHHALVTTVKTSQPHQEQGWQVFLPEGPLALLPMFDRYRSAVVWSMSPEKAKKITALSLSEIAEKMNESFGLRLGDIQVEIPVKCIPLVRRHAQSYSKVSVVLIGDAAHTIHPLAGQGANLGFRDAKALAELMVVAFKKGRHLGSSTLLGRYERARRADNCLMLSAMQFFQKGFGTSDATMVQLRKMGIRGFNRSSSAKRLCMKYALGQW